MATALFLCENKVIVSPIAGLDHSRVRVRLAEPKSKIRKTYLELFGKPRTHSEAAGQKHDLLNINRVFKNIRVDGRSWWEDAP